MSRVYVVKRKVQEAKGSYYVGLPRVWAKALGLKQSDTVSVAFNGMVKIKPIPRQGRR
jgi:antitoxin component of MazEF toxin-antitoxin module